MRNVILYVILFLLVVCQLLLVFTGIRPLMLGSSALLLISAAFLTMVLTAKNPPTPELHTEEIEDLASASSEEDDPESAWIKSARTKFTIVSDILTKAVSSFNQNINNLEDCPIQADEISSQRLTTHHEIIKKNLNIIKENSEKAFNISDNISKSAETAMDLSRQVKNGINLVTNSLAESLKQSRELYSQSERIGEILQIISEIAAKTNVLSINASIVSARAGIHGKAFEVVSREIRSLSAETDKSLKEIENVIKDIQTMIRTMVDKIESSEQRIKSEMDALLKVAGSLQGVVLGVEVIHTVSQLVKDQSKNQEEVINQVIEEAMNIYQKLNGLCDFRANISQKLSSDSRSFAKIQEVITRYQEKDSFLEPNKTD